MDGVAHPGAADNSSSLQRYTMLLCVVQVSMGACDAAAATDAYVEAFDSSRSALCAYSSETKQTVVSFKQYLT